MFSSPHRPATLWEMIPMSLNTRRQRHRRQVTVRLLVFALLFQVFAPFGQALALSVDPEIEYQVLCTVDGIKQVAVGQDGQPSEPVDRETCVFCLTHGSFVLAAPQNPTIIIHGNWAERTAYAPPSQQNRDSIWRASLPLSRAPPSFV